MLAQLTDRFTTTVAPFMLSAGSKGRTEDELLPDQGGHMMPWTCPCLHDFSVNLPVVQTWWREQEILELWEQQLSLA